MDQRDLLSRVRDLSATSETLEQLLRQIEAALEEGRTPDAGNVPGQAQGQGLERADVAPLLLRAREALAASERLVAASQAVRDVLTPSARKLVAATRGQWGAHQDRLARAAAALVRSQALLVPVGHSEGAAPTPGADAAVALMVTKLERHDRLSDEEKAVLRDVVPRRIRSVPSGQDLACEGSRPAESAMLLQGFAARCKVLKEGGRQITALYVPGDFVDLHSFLLRTMDHSVTAVTACTVAAVPHEALRRITEDHPHLARVLWLASLVDGGICREWLTAMGRRTALGRLAHLLCEMCLRLEVVGLVQDGAGPGVQRSFRLPLTQTELGDALGLSTVHVNRTVRELRERGIATWRGGAVTIQDWQRLLEAAEFNPTYLHLEQEPR